MKKLCSKRVLISLCVLLAALFVLRPPASRLRNKVLGSIAAALGRNVDVSSVHLRFLPRPGFDLENVVIHDDAAFGAEPLLRAPNVTASLQIAALLRGHIQIASLSLNDASLNLTRNSAGQWNLEDLIERTSRITVAPTGSGRHAIRPAFPYIEATSARVNFKSGTEKTHFALTDAKFALWQDSENAWGVRLRARPIRTDVNLTDTGVVDLNGSWQRSAVLHNTPLQLSLVWKNAQIGQFTKLVYGDDRGWRGIADVSLDIIGTPEDLKLTANASVDDFRRWDVLADRNLHLAAHCSSDYNLVARSITNLECIGPSGDGELQLKGSASSSASNYSSSGTPFATYDLRMLASDVPAKSALAFLRHISPRLARNLNAQGRIDGSLQLVHSPAQPFSARGSAAVQNLSFNSTAAQGELALGTVPFSLTYGSVPSGQSQPPAALRRAKTAKKTARQLSNENARSDPQLEVGPFNISLGRPTPLQVQALLSKDGYTGSIRGTAGIGRLLQSAQLLGFSSAQVNAEGGSTVDLNFAGSWTGDHPTLLGTAQLHGVQAAIRGVNGPLTIDKANLVLSDDEIKVSNITASAADAVWHGSIRIPRPCIAVTDCKPQFILHTPELSATPLNQYFNPALKKHSWYKFLSLNVGKPSYLLQARASGRISVDKLLLGNTECSHFNAGLQLDAGRVTLSGLSGDLLSGSISGDWEANFNARPPEYKASGNFASVSLAEVSELLHDGWIDGTGNLKYDLTATGWSLRDLLDSADLNAEFSIADPIFPHIVLTSTSGQLRARTFSGSARLNQGEISFMGAKLNTTEGVYTVSGTAATNGALNLRLSGDGAAGFLVYGTILQTRVSANLTTAASLKP